MQIIIDRTTEDTVYRAISSYEERVHLKGNGFRWNPKDKYWWTRDMNSVARLAEIAGVEFAPELISEIN